MFKYYPNVELNNSFIIRLNRYYEADVIDDSMQNTADRTIQVLLQMLSELIDIKSLNNSDQCELSNFNDMTVNSKCEFKVLIKDSIHE